MLTTDEAVLVVIDIQGKLAQSMHCWELLFENVQKIIKGAQALGLPLLLWGLRVSQSPGALSKATSTTWPGSKNRPAGSVGAKGETGSFEPQAASRIPAAASRADGPHVPVVRPIVAPPGGG